MDDACFENKGHQLCKCSDLVAVCTPIQISGYAPVYVFVRHWKNEVNCEIMDQKLVLHPVNQSFESYLFLQ